MKMPRLLSCCLLLALATSAGRAAEPAVSAEELPRVPATSPDEALDTFEVKPGYRMDLVASEPLLVDPVALSFDENGRMFVVEMVDYSERRDERLGRIKVLEDANGDGRFDHSTVFAADLAWPTAVICYDGGIFVGASPEILWLKDTTGDGVADERKVVFSGFGSHAPRLNVQSLLNNFTWGLDNRIHGATSRNGGLIRALNQPSQPPLDLRSRDFSFDPRSLTIRPEAGGGQHGMSFDNRGRKFVSSNSHHLRALMYEERYAGRNEHYTMPRGLVDIAVDGPAAEVFRTSPDEPWRVIRTKWRVEGTVPGIVEGGGRVSGYFTGATGATIYRGDALPESFLENAFVGDAGGNLVHRKLLRTDGVDLTAERPEDEKEVEFIASRDVWFRPVDFANAPDGALYILDMYREVIEHPWSIPESIKQHLDLNSGNDRGRIYRVVPEDFTQPARIRLGDATTEALVTTLAHSNGWHRDTASRLLLERQDPTAVPLLEDLLRHSPSGLGRMNALYSLAGHGALSAEHLLSALEDADDRVRQHAVRLSETFPRDEALVKKLASLSTDDSPHVRYQLAFTLGQVEHPARLEALAKIVHRDAAQKWFRAALLSSLATGAAELFEKLAGNRVALAEPGLPDFIIDLVGVVAGRNQPEEISRIIGYLEQLPPELSFSLAHSLGEGLVRAGSSLAQADSEGKLRLIIATAAETAADGGRPADTRRSAIDLLGLTSFSESGEALLGFLGPGEPQAIQLAALRALDRFSDKALAPALVKRWRAFTPRVRAEVLALLVKRPERVSALLQAIEQNLISAAEIPAAQVAALKDHTDPAIRDAAGRVLSSPTSGTRKQAVEAFLPALQLAGNFERGRNHYLNLCAACHRSGGDGHAVGPDLVTLKAAGSESLLANIVDPNREVAPQYVVYLVETKDGSSHFGMIIDETAGSVTLRQIFGTEIVLQRNNVVRIQSQDRSIMPEGLEAGLDDRDMADLLHYILNSTE